MSKEAQVCTLRIYADDKGREPFTDWLQGIRDPIHRRRILARLRRLETGNSGDSKSVGEQVFELRLHFGPGYRIYYARHADVIIVILLGGTKSTQRSDIDRARKLWQEYLNS